ncbi:MAG: hypothetical protein U1A77_22880 [Pirellulales bacterium]
MIAISRWLSEATPPVRSVAHLDSTTVAFASGKAARTVAPRMPPLDGCHWSLVIGHWSLVTGHWSLVIGHWSLVIGSTRDLTSDVWLCVVSIESNECAEETV